MATIEEQHQIIESIIVSGDLSKLSTEQRNIYYRRVCESLGLNHLTRPFDYLTLNGKMQLYAKKDCTDQLRKIHSVSIRIVERAVMDDLMVVTAEAADKTGRTDSSIGAVSIAGLRGEAKANALMKAETKARRRVTLSLCGLGILDESEIGSIPEAQVVFPTPAQPRLSDAIIQTKAIAIAKPEKQESPTAIASNQTFEQVQIRSIEEHTNSSGTVWKVTCEDGAIYACSDDYLVGELNAAMLAKRPIEIEWRKVGAKRLIIGTDNIQ